MFKQRQNLMLEFAKGNYEGYHKTDKGSVCPNYVFAQAPFTLKGSLFALFLVFAPIVEKR